MTRDTNVNFFVILFSLCKFITLVFLVLISLLSFGLCEGISKNVVVCFFLLQQFVHEALTVSCDHVCKN